MNGALVVDRINENNCLKPFSMTDYFVFINHNENAKKPARL